jgi:O-antigen ligase
MFNIKSNKLDFILITLFSIYPLAILAGNFIINSVILTIGSLFVFKLLKKETDFFQFKDALYLLSFFFISLLINLFFTNNIYLSYQRVTKFLFVMFFIISFRFLVINYYQNLKVIYQLWCIFFLIVIIDLLIEFFIGKNMLGQSSVMPGRLGSFTGKESVIGNFFCGFCLIFLSYIYTQSKKISLNILLAVILIIISFLIGERANFLKTFIAISLFIFFVYKINYKLKILSVILILISSYVAFLSVDSDYKVRYFKQIKLIFTPNGLTKYLNNSRYGAHRNVAKEIFLDNPLFGVGIKNFRIESGNKIYNGLDHKKNHLRVSNHPHELYYEFLSETGIFGLLFFLIFILSSVILSLKNYIQFKNNYQLSSIIFIAVSILPILPTGSFLSTYTSSIFWINYAIMMGYNNIKITKY